jgi:hypothetical protein
MAKWVWTSSNTTSSSSGTTQSASFAVGGPAYQYSGDTVLAVYTDTIYNTFAFVLLPPQSLEVAVTGKVSTATGKPSPMTEVILAESNIVRRAFTNAKGEYKFYGRIGPATIQAGGIAKSTSQQHKERGLDIQAP